MKKSHSITTPFARLLPLLFIAALLLATACEKSNNAPASVNSHSDVQSNALNASVQDDLPEERAEETAAIVFTDDDGRKITLDEPRQRIIALYSAHAENLFSLGAGDTIIGVHSTSIYPPETAFLPRFDYNGNPEYVIAANPDCVLVRPFITNRNPDFIAAIENAGIPVVSLYPDSLVDFDDYIRKLALLTGTEAAAESALIAFHQELTDIQARTAAISDKTSVFFESTETNLRTVTPDSMAGQAIAFAGGINVAEAAVPVSEGSSIAPFGVERILSHAQDIDVYVSQRGAMNAGGNLHAITTRPGFETLKAVQNKRVYVINEKLISSPTFRYTTGVMEMARFLYPEEMDDLSSYAVPRPATKRDLANILLNYRHLQVYVSSSSKYYEDTRRGHSYGLFQDVPWTDPDFDAIETAVVTGAIPWAQQGEEELFHPDAPVTRDMLALAVFMLHDFPAGDGNFAISDLDESENPRIVSILVDHGVFSLENGAFRPKAELSCQDILDVLTSIPEKYQIAAEYEW